MQNLYLKSLLFLILGSIILTSKAQPSHSQIVILDSALVKLHEKSMFNGVVLIAQDGKTLYKKALGIANIQTQEALSVQSSFNLASISKQFVAMMTMILQEQGKLQYDDKVQKFLPSFPYKHISIRQLLTHTSGLPEYFDLAIRYNNTLDTLNNEKMLQLFSHLKPKLNFESGSKWEYCNTGYIILALIIEKTSGMKIEDFFKKHITQPLSLTNTYVYYLNMQSPLSVNIQRVYGFERKNGKNYLNDLIRLDGVIGDGNIYSSAEDLLKWEQALYTTKLVSAKTLKEAFSPVKLNNGKTYNYGFGWFIEKNGNILNHTGSWVGFLNSIERNLEKKTTVIILTNSSNASVRNIVKDILEGKSAKIASTQLIKNVQLIDGTGTPARKEDIRLKDDKIWEIGNLEAFSNETITDGQGLVLSPGFIDSHSHHFGGLNKVPEAIPAVSQGITTIVIGQDGGSYPMDTLKNFFKKHPVAINVASYTGHSTLRTEVMGTKSLYRTAKAAEVDKMKVLLQNELKKGSLGLATGLEYESAFFSNRDEILQLTDIVAQNGGRYMSHVRSEDINLDEAIDEIIEIGRSSKIPVQISHIKIAKKDQWGKSPQLLAKLQKARAEGINITADCYPYDFWNSTLRVLFPNRDYNNAASAEFAVNQLFDPEKSVLVRFAPNKTYAGKTISEIAKERNEKPSQTLMDLIAIAADFEEKNPDFDEGIEAIMGKSMDENDVAKFLVWPHTNICSDGSSSGHPRGHGTFTKILGRYVREQKLMPLETAIYKMTGLSAENLGINNRGIIANGNYADLVLFNPDTVIDNANIQNGKALSTGIEKVWVNGELVFQSQKSTGKYSGVLIKKQ
ncbi:D-aminopeptidase [Emticicia aquatica]|uniref:D-aminopeptidase n=1 Tax=Emticicia aquatica TaxID=1681835 RepID=A0ABN8EPN4_9BACT|nr:serine hydrolase [Emticicia aquatica]CAH0994870.1 D-aminopeptidase [Emticicia aquatica]